MTIARNPDALAALLAQRDRSKRLLSDHHALSSGPVRAATEHDSGIIQPYRWYHHVLFTACALTLLWLALGVSPG